MSLLAIDPGNRQSAFVVVDDELRPLIFAKVNNDDLITELPHADTIAIEQIGHYGTGMPAGRDVFDTCRFIGRIEQALISRGDSYELVLRVKVKAHLTGSARAKDSNIRQALVDRFAPGEANYGKGTKAAPGWFYGFHADVWQAYALAVYAADQINNKEN